MPLDLHLTLLLGMVLLSVVVLLGMFSIMSTSLMDMVEGEAWNEIIALAAVAVLGAVILSIFEFEVLSDPKNISVNVTGVLIPLSLSIVVIVLHRDHLGSMAASVGIISVAAFFLTRVESSMVVIDFPLWLIPPGMAALLGYFTVKGDIDFASPSGKMRITSITYATGNLGMLIGGDLFHLPVVLTQKGSNFILGAGGITDFVFLTGVIGIAMAWVGQRIYKTIEEYRKDSLQDTTTS